MAQKARTRKASVPFDEFHRKQMQAPEYAQAYAELEPEFEIIEQLVALRSRRRVTQAELARRIGASQSSIARLESRKHTRDLDYLRRLAEALDARLEIRLVPREARATKGQRSKVAVL